MVKPNSNWRNDPGISSTCEYKRKFSLFPVLCSDGSRVWLKSYYKKYEHWSHSLRLGREDDYLHTDFIENITEAEFIIRRLSESH